jgi:dipeptidase E
VRRRSPHIIAVGGGGNNAANPDRRLDAYVLRAAGRANPRICFLPTATGDSEAYVARFYASFATHRCRPSHVPLFHRTPDLEAALLTQDVIYVGGGNTKSMLAVWREWGVDDVLHRAWRMGIVIAGVSAGAICWFDRCVTDSWAGALMPLAGLGWLGGTCCPHYDGEPERRPALHALVSSRRVPPALAIDDGAAAHFVGRRLFCVVSCRSTGGAYRVAGRGGAATETALEVRRLR